MNADELTAVLDAAAEALRNGELVVYPTETVYGLGGDAVDPVAIERVFEAKRRPRDDPLSMALPDVDAAMDFVEVDDRTRAFMDAFLPGPVTVLCERTAVVPEALTGGRDQVGIRIPDHEVALGLLERVAPVTATSANLSGQGSVTRVADLDTGLVEKVAVVVDGGETPGSVSTVVHPGRNEVLRRGAMADEVAAWLAEH